VTIDNSKHATQPWTFVIDRPGPAKKESKRERYATPWSAKRGARRMLGEQNLSTAEGVIFFTDPKTGRKIPVQFIINK
jgi:hypothetical protein